MANIQGQRAFLVSTLRKKGCNDEKVLSAINKIPRENFLASDVHDMAYNDTALQIACNQTISQPYVVAKMTELLLSNGPLKKVCEIGTGSGYQAAILSLLINDVYTIERYKFLYESAMKNLKKYPNVHCLYGDGYLGWVEAAPFDGIILTAAVKKFPNTLRSQMDMRSIAVYPEGDRDRQRLVLLRKNGDTYKKEYYDNVVFVPMLSGIVDVT